MSVDAPARESPASLRSRIRSGELSGPTAAVGLGWVQANLLVVPAEAALAFSTFCKRNPRACPVLDMTDPGDPHPLLAAPEADLRTDLPRYRVYVRGELVEEPPSIERWWRDDLVAFLLGCSFTFEQALVDAGVRLRHVDEGRNVAMYVTQVPCIPAGPFQGQLVVSMRPIARERIAEAVAISSAFPLSHGGPVAVGAAADLGISTLAAPDFGDPIEIREDEEPTYWACGVTAEVAARSAGLDLVITHAPGHMFVTDWDATAPEGRSALVGDRLAEGARRPAAADHAAEGGHHD
jgi:uncharacterized protein YcsI (UPF0317 family)